MRTLFGIVKYANNKQQNEHKFLYDDDFNFIEESKAKYGIHFQTIDCQIMDVADEIAYAVHDLEDSLKMQFFSIEELLHEFKQSKYSTSLPMLSELINKARTYASRAETYGTSEEYSICFRKELTSLLLNLLINDIGGVSLNGFQKLGLLNHKYIAAGLKKLTFEAVKRRPDIIRYELLGKKILKELYTLYSDPIFNRDLLLLPAEYRDIKNRERTILDYMGGMMDLYAIEQYKIYFGEASIKNLYTPS